MKNDRSIGDHRTVKFSKAMPSSASIQERNLHQSSADHPTLQRGAKSTRQQFEKQLE